MTEIYLESAGRLLRVIWIAASVYEASFHFVVYGYAVINEWLEDFNFNMVNSKFHFVQSFCEIFTKFTSFHVYNAGLIQSWWTQSSTNLK